MSTFNDSKKRMVKVIAAIWIGTAIFLFATIPVNGLAGEAVSVIDTSVGKGSPVPRRSLLWELEKMPGYVLTPEILAGWPLNSDYGYDVDHTDLHLNVDFTHTAIEGMGGLNVTITESGLSVLPVDLDLNLSVSAVRLDGTPVKFAHANSQVLVTLSTPPLPGAALRVEIDYGGTPARVGNKSMLWDTHQVTEMMYTLSTPYSTDLETVHAISHYWRPCKDVPDDKSTFACEITVPDDFTACANGSLTSEVDNADGTRTYTWRHNYPVAPYLIAVAVTNYQTIEESHSSPSGSTLIQHFVYPEKYNQALESLNITDEAMTFFDGLFGEYPFVGEKFGFYHTGYGPAVEEQTIVALPAWLSDGTHTYDWLLVHELSHMWWGDSVTNQNWAEVWLHEGFASYSEALWQEHLGGFNLLRNYMLGMDSGPYPGTIYDPPYVWAGIVYDKGAWVLHMLRHIMGDEDFFAMLPAYHSAHEYGNAVTDDLITICETIEGSDLDWFFEPWLYHEGRPAYQYAWTYTGSGPYTVQLLVAQVQSQGYPTYTMPIDVRVAYAGGQETYVVWNNDRNESYQLVMDNEPVTLSMDPDNWILADFSEGVSEADDNPPTLSFLEQNVPNPFNPTTIISFEVFDESPVHLGIYDLSGRLIRALVSGVVVGYGRKDMVWDGKDRIGNQAPSGVYIYRLSAGNFSESKRMTLVR